MQKHISHSRFGSHLDHANANCDITSQIQQHNEKQKKATNEHVKQHHAKQKSNVKIKKTQKIQYVNLKCHLQNINTTYLTKSKQKKNRTLIAYYTYKYKNKQTNKTLKQCINSQS